MKSLSSATSTTKSFTNLLLEQCYHQKNYSNRRITTVTTNRSLSLKPTTAATASPAASIVTCQSLSSPSHSFPIQKKRFSSSMTTMMNSRQKQQERCVSSSASSPSSSPFSSSAAIIPDFEEEDDHNQNRVDHCKTCTCENALSSSSSSSSQPLPPPLPPPVYSFHKRVLPPNLTSFSSPKGQTLFLQSLQSLHANSYFPLSEQFINQSDPAYCGITTLCMICNAMCIDPNIRWKGGWRWFGDEDFMLDLCCLEKERVKRVGVCMEEFVMLGRCHGVRIDMKRPDTFCNGSSSGGDNGTREERRNDLDQFRKDVIQMVQNPPSPMTNNHAIDATNTTTTTNGGYLVVSFERASLSQTGGGHFSPIAAYHPQTDSVLVLDVARFKYSPYWVSLADLYESMKPTDESTGLSRGWFLLYPPPIDTKGIVEKIVGSGGGGYEGPVNVTEGKRSAECVPLVGTGDICPMGEIKKKYCSVNLKQKQRLRRLEEDVEEEEEI
uniref:glutathione gamma-glutamylcysteinyltransferase n=1 Tax=Ditylum brightwellii TaxID=49249 RepID=A0A7S4RM29_9STRA|mmetsp:Transcript_1828/g.2819  ORF Transcript_1828/g.2819 Transcript_1828/m.2819 type:complete len:495 (+) Transcript_1828:113-1597(+)